MTTARDGSSDSQEPQYLTKKVVLNGQTVTLYSANGVTWLSSPDQLPDVMARLENTRILLTDPKAAAEQGITPQPAAPKAPGARYRMKGPKPRPILQPDGTLLPPTERAPVAATDTKVSLSSEGVEVLDDSPAARIKQLRAPKEEAKKAAAKVAKVEAKAVASAAKSVKTKVAAPPAKQAKAAALAKNANPVKPQKPGKLGKLVKVAKAAKEKNAPSKAVKSVKTKAATSVKATKGGTKKAAKPTLKGTSKGKRK